MTAYDERGLVRVSGTDAAILLQGLATNDVLALEAGSARYAALLSPQGKILCDFLVLAEDGGYALDCPRAEAAGLARRLNFYKLRAKASVADVSEEWGVQVDVPEGSGAYRDPRHPDLGWRRIVARAAVEPEGAAYEARRIALGVPSGGRDFAYGDTFPHEANLDRLHGLDFKKGCYVGQEVVSRVEHRGLARKRVVRVTFDGPAPPAGAEIKAGDVALGVMATSAAGHGLAMARLDRLAEAGGAGIADGIAVRLVA